MPACGREFAYQTNHPKRPSQGCGNTIRLHQQPRSLTWKPINKREAWNKGKLVGQKPPLKPKDIWAIRIHLQNAHAVRDLAMFNLAIDSKLRGCDLVNLRVRDITHGNQILPRAMVDAAENTAARAVRTDRADQSGCRGLDGEGTTARQISTSFRAAFPVRPMSRHASMRGSCITGSLPRAGFIGLRNAFHAANQGNTDLQTDEEPEGRSAVCLAIPSWKARSGISVSRWMTRWRFRSRLKSSDATGGCMCNSVRPLSG